MHFIKALLVLRHLVRPFRCHLVHFHIIVEEEQLPSLRITLSIEAVNVQEGCISFHLQRCVSFFPFQGGFGIVYRVHSPDGRQFALKRTLVNNEVDLANMKREITIVVGLLLFHFYYPLSCFSHRRLSLRAALPFRAPCHTRT